MTAQSLGIRVLVDLVLNHTSDTHHWFLEARRDRDGRFRDCYVWADEPQPDSRGVVFPGEQESTWSYDERAATPAASPPRRTAASSVRSGATASSATGR